MKTIKMSLANLEGKLSRNEMKKIHGGSTEQITCYQNGNAFTWENNQVMADWISFWTAAGHVVRCSNGYSNGITPC